MAFAMQVVLGVLGLSACHESWSWLKTTRRRGVGIVQVVVGVLGCPNLPLAPITDADGAAGAAARAGEAGVGVLFSAMRGCGAFAGALQGEAQGDPAWPLPHFLREWPSAHLDKQVQDEAGGPLPAYGHPAACVHVHEVFTAARQR